MQSNGLEPKEVPVLHSGEKKRLQRAIGERVYHLSKVKGQQQELFRKAYTALKVRYQVPTYKEIKQNQLQDALRFLAKWDGRT